MELFKSPEKVVACSHYYRSAFNWYFDCLWWQFCVGPLHLHFILDHDPAKGFTNYSYVDIVPARSFLDYKMDGFFDYRVHPWRYRDNTACSIKLHPHSMDEVGSRYRICDEQSAANRDIFSHFVSIVIARPAFCKKNKAFERRKYIF